MAIDALRDGFVRLCFDPSLNLLGDKCRMVIEGQFTATGASPATADALVKVTATGEIDSNFGEGSVLAESLKVAISCCGNGAVEVFALPRADAAGAVQAEYELTVTGPATTDGRVDIYWGDSQWNISVAVAAADTDAVIAAAIVAAMPAGFPYTATSALGVVTLVARNGGTVGNYLNIDVNWHGRNSYLPEGITLVTTQSVVGSVDPVALNYESVLGECCVCCFIMLYDDSVWQNGPEDYLNESWACDKPQCFGHGYTYNAGSLGQILASDTNAVVLSRMAHDPSDPNFPWLKVAAYGAQSCCSTVDNPEISIQGPTFGVLGCIKAPEGCVSAWTFDEQVQLRESGFVVTVPVSGGGGALTSPMVTNDITNNRYDSEGRENLTFQSVSSRRLASVTATEIAKELQIFNGQGYFSAGTAIRQGTQGTNKAIMLGAMRAWVQTQVGILFSEFPNLNEDLTMTDSFETEPACQGIPGMLSMNLVYRPPVRVRGVTVNAKPSLLNNC